MFKDVSVEKMFLTLQDLKVDQTVIPSEYSAIFITNINIPQSELINIDNVLERVKHLVLTDYINIDPVLFQVCATYQLRNVETNELRQWTGSFNPRGNQANTLCPFQRFNSQFKNIAKASCSEENILRKLRFYHTTTDWVFERLTSIIISFQSEIAFSHPTLLRRNLAISRHGKRTISSILLP